MSHASSTPPPLVGISYLLGSDPMRTSAPGLLMSCRGAHFNMGWKHQCRAAFSCWSVHHTPQPCCMVAVTAVTIRLVPAGLILRPAPPRDLPCSPPDSRSAAATLPVLSGPALGRADSQAPKRTAQPPRDSMSVPLRCSDYETCPRGTQSFRDVPDTVVSLSWPYTSILYVPSSLQTWRRLSHCPLVSHRCFLTFPC